MEDRKAINDCLIAKYTGSLAAFTRWLFFATAVLALFGLWQVVISRNTARRQLRAYVVTRGKDINQRETDGRFVLRIDIQNTGQTPAYEMNVISRTCILDYPVEAAFNFDLDLGKDPSAMTLGSQECVEHDSIAERVLSDVELAEVTSPTTPHSAGRRLYSYGTATYRDIFGQNRYTNFCFSLIWDEDGSGVAHASQYHNDAN